MKTQIKHLKTLKVRVKDKHAKLLREKSRCVNFVWNYINELSFNNIKDHGRFLSRFDIHKYTNGSSKILGLDSQSIQAVGDEYVTRRKQFKKAKLKWRVSHGSKRSLGYIPFKKGRAEWRNGQVWFNGHFFSVWDSYGLSKYDFRNGTFSEDARGRWYFNVVVDAPATEHTGTGAVGIDFGCKEAAATSDGEKLVGRQYRELETKLATAQRARNKKRVQAIHAKIKNRRKDEQHKFTTELVQNNALIVVGNVSSSKLVKTKMAKSVLDAGWGQLKTMLDYKCAHAGIVFMEVNEAYTTQTCSCCGAMPDSRPQGIAGLGMREWTCSECGVTHDRDVNAARNILALGHERLAEGIPVLYGGEDVNKKYTAKIEREMKKDEVGKEVEMFFDDYEGF